MAIIHIFITALIIFASIGLFRIRKALSGMRYKGQRIGAIIHITLTMMLWVGSGVITFYFGQKLFYWVLQDTYKIAMSVSVAVGLTSYHLIKFLIRKLFGFEEVAYNVFARGFSQSQRQIIAVHETGHLLAHAAISPSVLPTTVAKVGSGLNGVAGYVRSMGSIRKIRVPSENRIVWECQMLLAGIVAEDIVYGQVTYGGGSDFKRWGDLANIILREGLSQYPFPLGDDKTSQAVRVKSYAELLKDHRESVYHFLGANKSLLIKAANELQAKGKLTDSDCRRILNRVQSRAFLRTVRLEDVEL